MKMLKKYSGVIVPMVTPLDEKLNIDKGAVEKIVNSFVENKVAPFLLGTTGESVSISAKKQAELVMQTLKVCNQREKVYAGITGNCLDKSIELSKVFNNLGVDAVVAHLPFYYPLSDIQMLKYFEELAEKTACPLFLYNNPITTNYSIPLDVIEKISHHPNVVGFKDSERGEDRLKEALNLWKNRNDFSYLLGWAAKSAYSVLNGADGIVPSTGNICPGLYKELFESAFNGNIEKANELQTLTNEISEIYQKERNLSGSLPALKYMMSLRNLCKEFVFPPLYPINNEEKEKIELLMKDRNI